MTKVTNNLIPKGNKRRKTISIAEKSSDMPTIQVSDGLEQKIDKFLKTFKKARP